jgi:outer membrane protein assembly factor BamB
MTMVKMPTRIVPNLLVLLTLLFLGLGCSFDPYRLLPKQLISEPTLDRFPPAISGRTISQGSSASVVWQRSDIFMPRNLATLIPGLKAGHGYVVFVNFLGGALSQVNRLDVLDAETGATLWQSERFSDHEAVAISKDKAFVLLNEGSPLNIYSIQDGSEPLVSFNYFQEATHFYMFPFAADEHIFIYYHQGNGYLLQRIGLDGKELGAPRRLEVVAGRHPRLFLFDAPFFLSTYEEYVWANFDTGEEIWRVSGSGRVDSWPALSDNVLVISAGDGLRYSLTAINTINGEKLWESEEVFGPSVVMHQGSLYALRDDAVLAKLDITTGQLEEEITFEPASTNFGKWVYLASDGERLFVYFGDSQELFAIKVP